MQVPKDKDELAALQARLRKRFPVDTYNQARSKLDPNRILSNNMLEKLFPLSEKIWKALLLVSSLFAICFLDLFQRVAILCPIKLITESASALTVLAVHYIEREIEFKDKVYH